MNRKPSFSIITCTFNSDKYLKQCLNSVKEQQFKDFEHIIVDGFSTDNTVNILKQYKENLKNVYIYNQKANGISSAMNFAINKAKGKYIFFLHSDDCLKDKNVLLKVSKYLVIKNKPDMLYGKIICQDSVNRYFGIAPKFPLFFHPSSIIIKFVNYIPHQATFIKKDIFEKYGMFDTSLKYCMDYEYWQRITPRIDWKFMPLVVAKYRIHEESLSSNPNNMCEIDKEYNTIWNKYLNNSEKIIASAIRRVQKI